MHTRSTRVITYSIYTALLLAITVVWASGLGETMVIKNIFLPLRYNQETNQTYQLKLQDLRGTAVHVRHSCTATVAQEILPVKNGQATVEMTVDLVKASKVGPVTISISEIDAKGKIGMVQQEIFCHTSIVPFQTQVQITGSKFTVKNLTSKPFILVSAQGVKIEKSTPVEIQGSFKSGATIRLKEHGEVRLK